MSDSELSDQEMRIFYVLHKVLHLETLEDRILDLENKNIELDVNYRILKSQLDKITNKSQNLDDVTETATDPIGPSGSTVNYDEENENRQTPPAEIDNILSIEDQEILNEDESFNDPLEFCTTSLNESENNDFDVDTEGQSQSSNVGQLVQIKSEDLIGSSSGSTANYADENRHTPPAEIDNILSIEDQEILNENESFNNVDPLEFCTTSLYESEKNDFDVDGQSQSSNSGQLVQFKSEVMEDYNSNPAGFIDMFDQLLIDKKVKNKPTTDTTDIITSNNNNSSVELDTITININNAQEPVFDDIFPLPLPDEKLNLNPAVLLKRIDPSLYLPTINGKTTRTTIKESKKKRSSKPKPSRSSSKSAKSKSKSKVQIEKKAKKDGKPSVKKIVDTSTSTGVERKIESEEIVQKRGRGRIRKGIITTSKKSESYKCKICPTTRLNSREELTAHYQSHNARVDVKSKIFECQICPRVFQGLKGNSISRLRVDYDFARHMRQHLGNLYECPTCLRKFSTRRNLTDHLRVHTGEKPYSCSECRKNFTQCGSLARHKKKFHKWRKTL